MRRRWLSAVLASGVLAAAAAGCGDDFPNDPRPPSPIDLSAKIDDKKVTISPVRAQDIGAGLVNITILNLTDDEAQLTLTGPTEATSEPIVAGGVAYLKTDLETGEYVASAAGANDFNFEIGPQRDSAQDELLLP